MPRRRRTIVLIVLIALAIAAGWRWNAWSRMINAMMPADSRPGRVVFAGGEVGIGPRYRHRGDWR